MTSVDAAAGSVWAPARRRLTAGLVLTVTLVAFESLAVSAVMPSVSDDLGQLSLYGWVFSGFFLGNLVGVVLAGQAADRRGLAAPFAVGLALFAGGLLAGGAAPSMPVLVVARVAQGLGAGAIPAVAYTSVGRAYPPAIQARVFAVFSTAWVVPGLIGPTAASALASATSWRFVFLALLPLVGVAAAITMPALAGLPTTTDHAHDGSGEATVSRGRIATAIVLAAGCGLVLGGLTSGHVLAALALVACGAPLLAGAFVRLVPAGTATFAAGLPATISSRGVLTFAFFGADAFVPLALTDVRDQDAWVAGVALTGGTMLWTAAAWVQQRLLGRLGARRLVRTGFLAVAAGIGGAFACLGTVPVPIAIVLWSVAGFGIGLAYAPLSVTVLATARPGAEGASTAALQLTDTLGVALGTGTTGVFVAVGEALDWSTRTSLTGAFSVMLAAALLGAMAARRVPAVVT
jgi:MFS family permease